MINPLLQWQRVRVVGLMGKAWKVDPSLEQDHVQLWRLWLWEGQALAELDWDPGEWRWPEFVADQGPPPFFAYSAKLARRVFGRMQSRPPTQRPNWYAQGISRLFLQALWVSWRPRKISYFLWLLTHKRLPVGSWLSTGELHTCPGGVEVGFQDPRTSSAGARVGHLGHILLV